MSDVAQATAELRIPWLCRIGLHTRTFLDGAWFSSAKRCDRCGRWVDRKAGDMVDRERELWSSGASVDEVATGLRLRDVIYYRELKRQVETTS